MRAMIGRAMTSTDVRRDLCMLARCKVSLMVAASAACGWLLARPAPEPELFPTLLGTAALAWACSAWNQVQERDVDALLPRTMNRPLPQQRISVRNATCFGFACFSASVVCLYWAGGVLPALMAFVIAGVYNGLYTPLKRHTSFALLVGALVGALPPVIGWLCAGGGADAPELWLLYGVYVLWQAPHFWLRVERDSRAYAEAGLPLPAARFSGPGYRRLLRLWVQAHAAAVLLLPLWMPGCGLAARIALAAVGLGLCLAGGWLSGSEKSVRPLLRLTDGGMAAAVLILALDRVATSI